MPSKIAPLLLYLGLAGLLLGSRSASLQAQNSAPAGEQGRVVAPQSAEPGLAAGMAGSPAWQPLDATQFQVTQVTTHTTFLPMVTKSFGPRPGGIFGMQIYSTEGEALTRTVDTGARWVRMPLYWAFIEPKNTSPQEYHWSAELEQQLVEMQRSGLEVILTIHKNPSWAATSAGGPVDLVDISELVEFVVAAVERYGAPPYSVRYWEFYNEPDNTDPYYAEIGWGNWGNSPKAYADMLAAVYGPIKLANAQVQVLFGGIAYDWWVSEGGIFAQDFLDKVLGYGAGAHFDIMNFHFYPELFRAKWDPYGPGLIGKTAFLRDKLASYGVHKPMICTEAGTESRDESGYERQANSVVIVYAETLGADLLSTTWFMLMDEAGLSGWKSGLLTEDLDPKPAYYTYQIAAQQLGSARFVRTLTLAETGTTAMEVHEFVGADGQKTLLVGWTNNGMSYPLTLSGSEVAVLDKFGVPTTVRDADDGQANGKVQIMIGASPVYMVPTP